MAAMVDCRSLIEFCRAFEQHRNRPHPPTPPPSSARKSKSLNPLSHPFCSHSSFAAIDALLLILVLIALSVLAVPSFRLLLHHFSDLLLPLALDLLHHAPLFYLAGLTLILVTGIFVWEFINHHFRKCGNPYCKGLRKAVEFDIQLESEECVRYLPPAPRDAFGVGPLELGRDHKELEAELRKMAPLNGRTVLIFRSPCGCPAGRMEVWGAKKVRRIKK